MGAAMRNAEMLGCRVERLRGREGVRGVLGTGGEGGGEGYVNVCKEGRFWSFWSCFLCLLPFASFYSLLLLFTSFHFLYFLLLPFTFQSIVRYANLCLRFGMLTLKCASGGVGGRMREGRWRGAWGFWGGG